MLNFGDFIQVYVFTTNHHLKRERERERERVERSLASLVQQTKKFCRKKRKTMDGFAI